MSKAPPGRTLSGRLMALAISLLALGVLERDGVWVLAGIAAAVVSGVVFAIAKAMAYFFTQVWS